MLQFMSEDGERQDSIEGWKKRFPLPESLENVEFRKWAFRLDRRSQLKLSEEILDWYFSRLDLTDDDLFLFKIDQTIGGLWELGSKGSIDDIFTAQDRGFVMRMRRKGVEIEENDS